MGGVGPDVEDEERASLSASKRFKFSKKCFDDVVAVDYASVPRKLRSAIKKRCRGSISQHFLSNKKLLHIPNGHELSRKYRLKKSKVDMKQGNSDGSIREVFVDPITKDEEEVVEALSALAAMFPETAKRDKINRDCEKSETKPSAFSGLENSKPGVEDTTKMINSDNPEPANCSFSVEGLAGEVPGSSAEHGIERSTCNGVVSCVLSGAQSRLGSKMPQPDLTLASGSVERVLRSAAGIRNQHGLLYTGADPSFTDQGSQLWPGLSSTEACDSDLQRCSPRSSASKFPATFADACCSLKPPAFGKSITAEKCSQVQIDSKKSWKRSCTHVYISNLIKNLQITERGKTLQKQCTQSTAKEESNLGAYVTSVNLKEGSNAFSGIVSMDGSVCSAAERNLAEIRNAILLHQKLLQDQQLASTTSRLYPLQKQNIDFFSQAAGGSRGEISNGTAKADHDLGMTTRLENPNLQSEKHTVMPFVLPQNCYSSNTLMGHQGAALARQVQLPLYLGSTNYDPLVTGVAASSKLHPWQQRQQNWTEQCTSHFKPGRVAAAPCLPNWQNGGQDTASLNRYTQSHNLPRPSAEGLVSNYTVTSRQQQQLFAISPPLPLSLIQGQQLNLPQSYDVKGGGRLPDSLPPLQLLCNNHL